MPFTLVSGPKMALEKAKEHRSGKTAANTPATGKMTKLMVREDSSMATVTFMRASGTMTRLRAKELMSIWTVPSTLVTGKKIDNTAME